MFLSKIIISFNIKHTNLAAVMKRICMIENTVNLKMFYMLKHKTGKGIY